MSGHSTATAPGLQDEPNRRVKRLALAGSCLCALAAPAAAAAPATQAGTIINNVATLAFDDAGARPALASNAVSLVVAETLDVMVTADQATAPAGATGFVVSNTGNGSEAFALAVASDQAGVAVTRLAVDTDADGRYDPAIDQALAAGAPLTLAPGARPRVFVLVDATQVAGATRIALTASAATGSGTPGTVFESQGDGGGDAVVGATGGVATAATTVTPASDAPSLVKSQSVVAPDGSDRPLHGATITYRLAATFPAATRGVAIADPLPSGTTYVPGSLTLDGQPLTDAGDGDRGSVDAAGVAVALGDVAAGVRTIQFSVKIQ